MKYLTILVLIVGLFSFPLISQAQRRGYYQRCYYRCPDYRYRDRYSDRGNPGTKLVEGVSQVALSWTQIPKEVVRYSEEHDPVSGIVVGTIQGTALAARDCLEGGANTALFLMPPYEYEKTRFLSRSKYKCRRKGKSLGQKIKELDEKFQEKFW